MDERKLFEIATNRLVERAIKKEFGDREIATAEIADVSIFRKLISLAPSFSKEEMQKMIQLLIGLLSRFLQKLHQKGVF